MNVFLNQTIANSYDNFYNTPAGTAIDNVEKQAMEGFLHEISNHEILELGCGTGHWTEFLSNQGFKVTAVDISDAMLAIAKAKEIEEATFLKADATSLPFSDSSFCTIIAITMLEFVEDLQSALNEIYRVLKPDGLLILGCLNIDSVLGKTKDNDETFRNAHFLSKKEIKNVLSTYENVVIKECVYMTPSFEIADNSISQHQMEGAFLAISARKKLISYANNIRNQLLPASK
jgi:ubiquinone/menaquinone biosynthesis C-methylase UbiE